MYGVLGFHQSQCAFFSICFLARRLAVFEQFVDYPGSMDGKKQDLKAISQR